MTYVIIKDSVENGKYFFNFRQNIFYCQAFQGFQPLLTLVLKFDIVNIHSIAVLDALLLQMLEQSHLAQLLVEIVSRLVIVEIDILHQPLHPGARHQPGAAVVLHLEGAGVVGGLDDLHILRLVDGHRRQGPQLLRHHPHEIPGALGGSGADFIQLASGFLCRRTQPLQIVAFRHQQVALVGRHDHGPVAQIHAVVAQLSANGPEVLHRVPALAAGNVHHVDQQTAPVDVPQEVMAQASTLRSALNDAGDVRHHEGHALFHVDHTQVGIQGGEVVVGNFRPGVGRNRQQGGFAHVGEAHQAHVRQQLQLQNHVPRLALQARLGKPGHLPGGGGIVGIAPAAPAALGQDEVLPGGHIHDDLIAFRIPNHRAPGHLDDQVLAPLARHLPALAVDTGLSGVLALVAEVQQGGQVVVDPENDAAAVAAVAAVRAAGGHIFFPVEGHRTVAAPAANDGNSNFIYKHRFITSKFVNGQLTVDCTVPGDFAGAAQ